MKIRSHFMTNLCRKPYHSKRVHILFIATVAGDFNSTLDPSLDLSNPNRLTRLIYFNGHKPLPILKFGVGSTRPLGPTPSTHVRIQYCSGLWQRLCSSDSAGSLVFACGPLWSCTSGRSPWRWRRTGNTGAGVWQLSGCRILRLKRWSLPNCNSTGN